MSGAERDGGRHRTSRASRDEQLRSRPADRAGALHQAGNQAITALIHGTAPLPSDARATLERAYSVDLGRVRLHAGRSAAEHARTQRAVAFTQGDDVYLGAGVESDPLVVAHELGHVVQQTLPGGGRTAETLEAEAAAGATGSGTVGGGAVFGSVQRFWPFDDAEEQRAVEQRRHDDEAETAVRNLHVLESGEAWKHYANEPLIGAWLRAHPGRLDPRQENADFQRWLKNPQTLPARPTEVPKTTPARQDQPSPVPARQAISEQQRAVEKRAWSTWSPQDKAMWARAQIEGERQQFVASMTPKPGSIGEAVWTIGEATGMHSLARAATGETEWSRPLNWGERFSEGVLGTAQLTQTALGVATAVPELGPVAELETGAALAGTGGVGEEAAVVEQGTKEGAVVHPPAEVAQQGSEVQLATKDHSIPAPGAEVEVPPEAQPAEQVAESTATETPGGQASTPAPEVGVEVPKEVEPVDPVDEAFAEPEGELDVRKNPPQAETSKPQTRAPSMSSADQERLLAEYEQAATKKLPSVVEDVLAKQTSTPTRQRLATLKDKFTKLMSEVGDAPLTAVQREQAMEILTEARQLAREKDFGNVQKAIWRRLRADPDLVAIEQRLQATNDAAKGGRALGVATMPAGGGPSVFDSLGVEHRVRLSDDPWLYNDPKNLLITDAAQNEQYLEAIRQQGVWPTTDVEEFVVRNGLSSQPFDFAPGHRALLPKKVPQP